MNLCIPPKQDLQFEKLDRLLNSFIFIPLQIWIMVAHLIAACLGRRADRWGGGTGCCRQPYGSLRETPGSHYVTAQSCYALIQVQHERIKSVEISLIQHQVV